ncbi:hypothetical protein RIF29_28100 [Crotalaria pallida]|uniref:Uncharacterized protein n=1 Tax=Crotalaria pallida TaxID=3830 RepID=A0AAN9ESN6_CROPI
MFWTMLLISLSYPMFILAACLCYILCGDGRILMPPCFCIFIFGIYAIYNYETSCKKVMNQDALQWQN